MKAFSDGYDTYIGEDLADALKAREELAGADADLDIEEWYDLDPSVMKKIWYEEYDAPKDSYPAGATIETGEKSKGWTVVWVTATVRDWVEHVGRGFLCSTEY